MTRLQRDLTQKLTLAGLLVGTLLGCPRSSCIGRGARVTTRTGDKPIEDMQVGDELIAVDASTGQQTAAVVCEVRRATRETIVLRGPSFELVCTPDHPLWDPLAATWASAGDWALGLRRSLLVAREGHLHQVQVEQRVLAAGVVEVFDLVLAHPFHAFLANGVVVHNKSFTSGCTDDEGTFIGIATGRTCACPSESGLRLGELTCPAGQGIVKAQCECTPPVCRTVDGKFVSATSEGLTCPCEGWQPSTPWYTGNATCFPFDGGLVGTCECPPRPPECRTPDGRTLTFAVDDGGFVFVPRPTGDAGAVPTEFPRCACAQPELSGRYSCGAPRPTAPTIATCTCPVDCFTDAGQAVQRDRPCSCSTDGGLVSSTWACEELPDAGILAVCRCEQ